MAKDAKTINAEEQMPNEQAAPATPNRDAYSQMWAEDNEDVDFNDKEARYGRMMDDRNELRERRKADSALGGLFDKHGWLGAMYMDLKENEDVNPFVWLADFCNEQGISIQEVLNDPKAQKFLTEKMANREKDNAERMKKADEDSKMKDTNLDASSEELGKVCGELGLSDEEGNEAWKAFWEMHEQAQQGVVSADTWKMFAHGRSYDADIKSASDKAGMVARNEKIQNKVRKPSETSEGMPPTLSQGAGAPTTKSEPKKKSFASDFFGDID